MRTPSYAKTVDIAWRAAAAAAAGWTFKKAVAEVLCPGELKFDDLTRRASLWISKTGADASGEAVFIFLQGEGLHKFSKPFAKQSEAVRRWFDVFTETAKALWAMEPRKTAAALAKEPRGGIYERAQSAADGLNSREHEGEPIGSVENLAIEIAAPPRPNFPTIADEDSRRTRAPDNIGGVLVMARENVGGEMVAGSVTVFVAGGGAPPFPNLKSVGAAAAGVLAQKTRRAGRRRRRSGRDGGD